MMKKIRFLLSMIFAAVLFAACGQTKEAENKETGETKTVTISHEYGQATVPVNPQKVISFDFGVIDTLEIMGVDVIGVPKAGKIPNYLNKYNDDKYTDVGGLKEPNFEILYELQPDVIFISGRQADLYEEFEKIAPTIYLGQDYTNFSESLSHNIQVIGQIMGKEDEATRLFDELTAKLSDLEAKVSAQNATALITMVNEGNMSVFGEASRFGILYEKMGFLPADTSIEESTHGQKISYEYLMKQTPDYLFVVDRGSATGTNETAKQVIETDVIKSTDVYKNQHIVYLTSDVWYSAYGGYQSTLLMIDEIRALFQ